MSGKRQCVISLGILPPGQEVESRGSYVPGSAPVVGKHLLYLKQKTTVEGRGHTIDGHIVELNVYKYEGDIEKIREALHKHIDTICDSILTSKNMTITW